MLGFIDGTKSDSYLHTLWGDVLLDKSDGLNFMYIICNEIGKVLLVVPIERFKQGTSDIINYSHLTMSQRCQ